MTEKQLKLLDFILPILSKSYPKSFSLNSLTSKYKKETGIKFDYKEKRFIKDRYNNKYFKYIDNSIDHIEITLKYKEIIDSYSSLTNYLTVQKNLDEENQKSEDELNLLQLENVKLQNENLKLQNQHLKRYILYASIGFISGAIVTNWKEILSLLRIIPSE